MQGMLVGLLRAKEGYRPAYHMNKDNWISICLDGTAPDDEIRNLIDMSFHLTVSKRKRKKEKTDEHTDLWHEEVQ